MTNLAYTSGDPANLTGGVAANMADISGPLTDIKTFLNGGNLDAGNLATSAKPATLRGPYQTTAQGSLAMVGGSTAGTYYISDGANAPALSGATGNGVVFIPIDPADHTITGLTTTWRLRVTMSTNGTAPAVTFTYGLYPVTASGGGVGSATTTLGTVVSGSTVARAAPAINSSFIDKTSDFSISSSGLYAFGMVLSGTMAANSRIQATLRLEYHHS